MTKKRWEFSPMLNATRSSGSHPRTGLVTPVVISLDLTLPTFAGQSGLPLALKAGANV